MVKEKKNKKKLPLEKVTQREILDWLWDRKIFCWKTNTVGVFNPWTGSFRKLGRYQPRGVADIIGIYKKKFLAIEVKRKGGKVSEPQREFLQKVIDCGGIGFVACSKEEVEEKLKPLKLEVM
jgi:hypothetical protein